MRTASLGILCSELSRGLHAAAQPLTILRASLDKHQTYEMSVDELRELAENSAAEVERVCTLFSFLQGLVSTESVEPQLVARPILPLIADVADGVNRLFERDGILLKSSMPETCYPVMMDKARTHQALSLVLLIAHKLSRAQDVVELIVSSSLSNSVRVTVQNLDVNLNAMSAEASLSRALAEAKIRSQLASFSWSLQPFSVHIDFQKAPAICRCRSYGRRRH